MFWRPTLHPLQASIVRFLSGARKKSNSVISSTAIWTIFEYVVHKSMPKHNDTEKDETSGKGP